MADEFAEETCCCGGSISTKGYNSYVRERLNDWRMEHRHEMAEELPEVGCPEWSEGDEGARRAAEGVKRLLEKVRPEPSTPSPLRHE